MSDIFISYFHEDRPHAETLARALEATGWSIWWDRTIPPGSNFDQVIEAALAGAKVVIVLWSQRSVQSRWVLNEAEEAAARNILVPVFVEDEVRIPLAFKRIQAADLVGWDGSDAAPSFHDLVATLDQRIGRRVALEPPSPGEPAPDDMAKEENPPYIAGPPIWSQPKAPPLLQSRAGLTGLLVVVFLMNYAETLGERVLRSRHGVGTELGRQIALAFYGLEGSLNFESHDVINPLAVYGYSASYFFLLPIIGLGLIAALWARSTIHGYRIFCLAIAGDYLLSLAFFVFFPVPERWAFPDSGAMLLSDRWSSSLIEILRPISGIDNSFPSTHVSFTVVIVLVAYLVRLRLRHTVLALGTMITLSTFVLGIHWIPDIVAGVAVGFLSVAAARRMTPFTDRAITT